MATLHFRGYPKQIEGASPGDLDYDYDRVSLTGPFQHQRGNYTRFGDVTALLKGIDDRYAIFGSGEEIAAEFDATQAARAARALEARLLLLRQWICEGHGLVGCVAVHGGATAVPRDERISVSRRARSFPDDADALEYQLNWNDRFDSGEPVRSYRFDYRLMHATPADDLLCSASSSRR